MPSAAIVPGPDPALRRLVAMDIVQTHTLLSIGSSLIPVPLLDSLAVSAVQYKLIVALAHHYRADFEVQRARAVAASIGVGITQEAFRSTPVAAAFGTWVAGIPVIGVGLRQIGWPAILAAYTYVLGKSYVEHYETGGQFANFKPPHWLESPVAMALR